MRRYGLVLAVICVCLSAAPASGAKVRIAGKWTDRQPFEGSTGDTIHFYLFTPEGLEAKKNYPLVLWLHGGLKSNGKGGPNMPAAAFYRAEHHKIQPCFVLRPVAIKGRNWVSPRGAGTGSHTQPKTPAASIPVVLELLEKTVKQNPVDRDRLHVVGASMGGYGVWDLIARHPKMFASAVPICGGGDPGKAALIKHMRIWAFHSADDRIVPVKGSRQMHQALVKASGLRPVVTDSADRVVSSTPKGRIRYTEFKTGGHNAWDRALSDPEVIHWVLTARRPRTATAPKAANGPGSQAERGFRPVFSKSEFHKTPASGRIGVALSLPVTPVPANGLVCCLNIAGDLPYVDVQKKVKPISGERE